jgi:23S rRNA pseudouridine1911/1915/1917 synthase
VYKPAGLLVQGDISGGVSLMDEVKEYIREKYKKPGNVFLGLVHRLDRNVSGIVLFGKTSKGASRLSEQFRENTIKKIYHAVIEGEIKPTSGTLTHYLKKDENKRIALVSETPRLGYEKSELSYESTLVTSHYSLITIFLKTGRFHQIRAQFSAVGHPIVGDVKYGFKIQDSRFKELALCATEIEFITATTNEVKNIKIDYPKEWASYLN